MPIKAVLLDLSGVVYQGGAAIPGSIDAIAALRQVGLPIRFVTNTTRSSKLDILSLLSGMGLRVPAEEIFTPVQATVDWLQANDYSAHLLVHPAIAGDFDAVKGVEGRAVVVGDAGEGFNYANMNAAFRVLSEGAPLLALANNRSFRDADGQLSLDAGAFVAALEFASGAKSYVLGKPSTDFYHAAVQHMGCSPREVVMVGDDADADVSGALQAGIANALLVRTGKYREGDESRFYYPPTETVPDLKEAVNWILARLG